jgi:hypothetical protein
MGHARTGPSCLVHQPCRVRFSWYGGEIKSPLVSFVLGIMRLLSHRLPKYVPARSAIQSKGVINLRADSVMATETYRAAQEPTPGKLS